MNITDGVMWMLFGFAALMLFVGQQEILAGSLVPGVLLCISGIAFAIAASALVHYDGH